MGSSPDPDPPHPPTPRRPAPMLALLLSLGPGLETALTYHREAGAQAGSISSWDREPQQMLFGVRVSGAVPPSERSQC